MAATTDEQIGRRVREALENSRTTSTQKDLAAAVGMTTDAMSRALSGKRSFSTFELAQIAAELGCDVYQLIMGEPDPLTARFAARHTYDFSTREHLNHTQANDQRTLDAVALVYRQASGHLQQSPVRTLPSTPEAVSAALGAGFIEEFTERIAGRVGVDVLRLPGLGGDYSLTVGDRKIIVLKNDPNWARANWSLAHELAHLALGHHATDDTRAINEPIANAFAAELLMPQNMLRRYAWPDVTPQSVAQLVWDCGASTEALAVRLTSLRLPIPAFLAGAQRPTTSDLLAAYAAHLPVAERMASSSLRHVPQDLVAALRAAVTEDGVNKASLAWLLDVDVEDIDIGRAPSAPIGAEELARLLGA